MKILGVIPARSGSKRVANKNIKNLNGKPLIAYTIEAALNSNLDQVIVSTDSEEIASISKDYGAEVLMRSASLSNDLAPTLPVIQDAVKKINVNFDAVMTLQPTSPMRNNLHINQAIKIFTNDINADSLVSVVRVPHSYIPEKLMRYDGKYLIDFNQPKRSQDMNAIYARNGAAIYLTKVTKLKEYIFGGVVLPYFMEKEDSFDIDDEFDWNVIEAFIKSFSK